METPRFRGYGLKLVILDLLRTPNHGYGIMSTLEETYRIKVSTGTVYPILASLRRSGLIKVAEEGNRKRKSYVITEKGERYLQEHAEELEDLKRKLETFRLFMDLNGDELKDALKEFFRRAEELDESQKEELKRVFSECARKMMLILLEH
ncbi:MAG: PadR family transcriptional regulator [Thermococci archaeon]|nr:PadR family transcriptional regulator [Thermococci archaeon]